MKASQRRIHGTLWPLLAPALLVLVIWAALSRPVVIDTLGAEPDPNTLEPAGESP
ncbi:MAG: hypothetical protein AAGI53_05430 [Planctomycetota bacterium]